MNTELPPIPAFKAALESLSDDLLAALIAVRHHQELSPALLVRLHSGLVAALDILELPWSDLLDE